MLVTFSQYGFFLISWHLKPYKFDNRNTGCVT